MTTPPASPCQHKNLTHDIQTEDLSWCPKGCEGTIVSIRVYCKDCDHTVYEASNRGEWGCKYGH